MPPESPEEIRKLRSTLQGVDFLFHLKVYEMDLLLSVMKKRSVPAGQVVIKQGDPGDAFYIVASGKLSIWVKKGFKNVQIDTRWPEQFFGEMALVSHEPRMATVKAEEPSELYVLTKHEFDSVLMRNPGISKAIKTVVAKRKAAN